MGEIGGKWQSWDLKPGLADAHALNHCGVHSPKRTAVAEDKRAIQTEEPSHLVGLRWHLYEDSRIQQVLGQDRHFGWRRETKRCVQEGVSKVQIHLKTQF